MRAPVKVLPAPGDLLRDLVAFVHHLIAQAFQDADHGLKAATGGVVLRDAVVVVLPRPVDYFLAVVGDKLGSRFEPVALRLRATVWLKVSA